MTEQEIAESKERSRLKYEAKKEQSQQYSQQIKEGVRYIIDNKIPIVKLLNSPRGELYLALECKQYPGLGRVSASYCIKSPKDTFSARLMKGLLGYRLKTNNTKFTFTFGCGNEVINRILVDKSRADLYKVVCIADGELIHRVYTGIYNIPHKLKSLMNKEFITAARTKILYTIKHW